MRLVFKKDNDAQINVFLEIDGQERIFSYIDMIKGLIESKNMEDPEIIGGFSEAEKNSIGSMVMYLNTTISGTKESDSKA